MNTTDEFFDSTEELRGIYRWARARYAAPWAVFGATLLRVAASTGPEVQLPGIIGGRASLNMMAAFVSPSGGGKGISDKVSRLAWPTPIIERPIGSGEGIAALFAPPKKEGAERITRAIINVSEIDTLAGIASRQGSILLAQLKAMAMGELLGQANASEATSRVVQPHTYRCCLSVGAQPGHTSVLFNDTTGGTPQRFLWFPTIDPDMPDSDGVDPEPLNSNLPLWARMSNEVVEIQYGPEEIRRTIIDSHKARQRGENDALDGHAVLTRCKVAAVLAIMHHRSVVSEADWQLSEIVMAVSDQTRDWVVTEARRAVRDRVRARALDRAVGEEFVDQRRLDVVKRRVLKVLEDGRVSRGDLRARMGKKEYRELLESAVAELASHGVVCRREAPQGGVHYELNREFSPELQFSPDNPSSGVLNREFSPEPVANVTDLDSRRSHESGRPKVSTAKWLAQHLAGLRSQGIETVKAFAVYRAGEAQGYNRSTIASVASSNPDVVVIDLSDGVSTWSITGEHPAYETAAEWIERYLSRLPDDVTEVDQTAFRHAAAAAGYSWDAARHAAIRSGRIDSRPAHGDAKAERVWRITTPIRTEGEQPA